MASGQPSKGSAPHRAVFATSNMPPRFDDELAALDRCVSAYRDLSIASLSALTDASGPGSGSRSGGGETGLAELHAQISTLQSSFQEVKEQNLRYREDNQRILQQKQELEQINSQLQKSPAAQNFEEELQRREQGLQQLTERCRQLQTDLAESQTAKAKVEAELAKQQPVLPQSSVAGSNGVSSRGVTPRNSHGGGTSAGIPKEVLDDIQSKVAVLKQDQQQLEDEVVNMYQTLFSQEIVSGLIKVLRRKENELIANADTGGAKGGGKGAPLKLRKKLDDATTRIEELEAQLVARKDEVGALQRHHDDMVKISKLESEAQISHFQNAWKTEMEKRKSLHQKVLELKGAIRVFCRVRPLVASDGDAINCIEIKDQENLVVHVPQDERQHARSASAPIGRRNAALPHERRTATGRECAFEFDRVFAPEDTQETVYEDVSDLVVSAADGYNVCIIAYGQTGSGKTYTMMGSDRAPGINMRALKELFGIGELRAETMAMTFSASILEIYNESIFDLLATAPRETAAKLDIKETNGHIWIPNLIRTPVKSVQDVEAVISVGDTNRSTFATDMNEHSSRSHLILSLYIAATNKLTNEKTASKLHLIDLAGSERVSKSHAEGARLREAQSINSSLSQLGDVIQRLKSQDAHVPYRNCSLTRLLSDSLGGASKTLLVVNLSPSKESAPESRSSCDFASRAKKVELGRATRQVTSEADTNKSPVGGGRPVSVGPSARMHRTRHSHTDVSALRTSRSVSGTNALPSPSMR